MNGAVVLPRLDLVQQKMRMNILPNALKYGKSL